MSMSERAKQAGRLEASPLSDSKIGKDEMEKGSAASDGIKEENEATPIGSAWVKKVTTDTPSPIGESAPTIDKPNPEILPLTSLLRLLSKLEDQLLPEQKIKFNLKVKTRSQTLQPQKQQMLTRMSLKKMRAWSVMITSR